MDKIKNAITSLEQAVLKLETAVHDEKKEKCIVFADKKATLYTITFFYFQEQIL